MNEQVEQNIEFAVKNAAARSLVAKLAEACNAVGGVAKQGRNQLQNYDYVRAADIAKVFRHELFKRGLVIVADEQELIQREFLTGNQKPMVEVRLKMVYRIMDGATELSFGAFGVAMDSGDKAIWKAKTGALKYFLRGLGIVPDEKDDPEADESVDKETAGVEIRKPQALRPTDTTIAPQKLPPPHDQDMPVSDLPRTQQPEPARSGDGARNGEYISDGQRKRMWAIAKDRGMEKSAVKNIYGRYGAEDDFHIPWKCYKDIMAQIDVPHA